MQLYCSIIVSVNILINNYKVKIHLTMSLTNFNLFLTQIMKMFDFFFFVESIILEVTAYQSLRFYVYTHACNIILMPHGVNIGQLFTRTLFLPWTVW